MSLSAAAAALNVPESVAKRSAEARSKATGIPVEDILAAWAGGGDVVATASPPPVASTSQSAPTAIESSETEAPATAPGPVASPAPAPTVRVVAPGPVEPPVLVGRHESPTMTMVGAAFLLLMALLIGLFAPAGAVGNNGVRSSAVAFSGGALAGQEIYLAENCAVCHTQQVRPIAADAGPNEKVTQADTNLVLGSRRYGPDLANVGSRTDRTTILSILTGAGGHPSYSSLGESDLAELVAYLSESK